MMPTGPRTWSTSCTPSRARLSRNGDIVAIGCGWPAQEVGHRERRADEHGHDEAEAHRPDIADPTLRVGLDTLEEAHDRIARDASLLHPQCEPSVVREVQPRRHQ